MRAFILFFLISFLCFSSHAQIIIDPDYDERAHYDYDVPAYFDYGDTVPCHTNNYWADTFIKVFLLDDFKDFELLITGHTDINEELHLDSSLSLKRAEYLKKFYMSKGLSPERIVIRGMRNRQPRNNCNSPDSKCIDDEYQYNRRVEVILH
jgi:hypothetical protein